MKIIPAIELLGGKCVNLLHGNYENPKVYSEKPIDVALKFLDQGAEIIHIIDLDGAKQGKSENFEIIKELATKVSIPIQVGGGIRKNEDVVKLLDAGIYKIIVGTKLVKDIENVRTWISKYGNVFIAGIDACESELKIKGWTSSKKMDAIKLSLHAKDIGIGEIIYTDVTRDNTSDGPNFQFGRRIAEATHLNIILSGGFGKMKDLEMATTLQMFGVIGIILGKSLYEKKIDLAKAISSFSHIEK